MAIPWEGLIDMYYIYCYENKINGHNYVGQTNNYARRIREHRSCAFNEKASSYNDLIHRKIREYGEDNFNIYVIEQGQSNNQDYVNEREQYWIQNKKSYCGFGQGYNMDLGGSQKYEGKLIKEEIESLKKDIQQGISYYDLQNKYNISASFISAINHGTYYFDENVEYPLYQYYKKDSDYTELVELLTESYLSLAEIARQLNIGYSTVKKINAGTLKKGLYSSYPIRKKNKADYIKEELLNSNLSFQEISDKYSCSVITVRRINSGETHKDDKYTYPLRNL